jgi:hypothetical protein
MPTVTLRAGSTWCLHRHASEPPFQKLSVVGVRAVLKVATSRLPSFILIISSPWNDHRSGRGSSRLFVLAISRKYLAVVDVGAEIQDTETKTGELTTIILACATGHKVDTRTIAIIKSRLQCLSTVRECSLDCLRYHSSVPKYHTCYCSPDHARCYPISSSLCYYVQA